MKIITPDYYAEFKCVGGTCPDNCCIGWEIDIDDEMYNKYISMHGSLGDKLRNNIITSEDGSRCFKLGDNDRCPFLNKDNLCEIILESGEENLCNICNDHPRYNNCFGSLRETGVGLSCIKAAELILGKEEKVRLEESFSDELPYEIDYDEDFFEYIYQIRNIFIDIVQNRNADILQRISTLLFTSEGIQSNIDSGRLDDVTLITKPVSAVKTSAVEHREILKKLIPINDEWTNRISRIKEKQITNQIVAEQLLVYYIFRHFLSAVYDYDILSKIKFAVLCTAVSFWLKKDSIAESACLVSKEIEYCSENIDMLLDMSWTEECMSVENLASILKNALQ